MKRCLANGCREQAVDHNVRTEGFKRKQYCAVHYEAYKAGQRARREREAQLPACKGCGTVKALRDDFLCRSCRDRADNEARANAVWVDLAECQTLDDLKSWLHDNVKVR